MEKLKYIIEDSTIAELLGVQNFTNKESAILELVKNSFDAKSGEVNIIFENESIVIQDDGDGMDTYDIRNYWMHIGKSNKGYEVTDKNNKIRILSGSKGIGRFALSRIGAHVTLLSKKNISKNGVEWVTNWEESTLRSTDELEEIGTKITISNLRDKWYEKDIVKLKHFLSRTYNDDIMSIYITQNGKKEKVYGAKKTKVEKYFSVPRLGINCITQIDLIYDSKKTELTCNIKSDEFVDDVKNYIDFDHKTYKVKFNIFDEFFSSYLNEENVDKTSEEKNFKKVLNDLGDFKADLYFSLKEASQKSEMDKFLYKHKKLPDVYESGVILYRNSFSISSFEGVKDWLSLGKRSRKSPAAASHPTGAWRVRENQLAGKVIIDKKENKMLQDLSNRQGFDENIYYELFIKIITLGISSFEKYRQSIIRCVNEKNKTAEDKEKQILDKVVKKPNLIRNLSQDDEKLFFTELKELIKENEDLHSEKNSTEYRYKYDVRILNVLATSGLKSTAIAHDLHNHRNKLELSYLNIIKAMKKYDIWDYVNDEKRTKYEASNIPKLLENNRDINQKMLIFMDTLLRDVEKKQFFSNEKNIKNTVDEIVDVWKSEFSWVKINFSVDEDNMYIISEDVLKVILDNLILNSVQQNYVGNKLNIHFEIIKNGELLEFVYKDDGIGLSKKYIDDPYRILEVHETSRDTGHGLGMWIVNNTIVMSGGKISKICGKNGFEITFTVGGKYE